MPFSRFSRLGSNQIEFGGVFFLNLYESNLQVYLFDLYQFEIYRTGSGVFDSLGLTQERTSSAEIFHKSGGTFGPKDPAPEFFLNIIEPFLLSIK
jgi:hypothetical protein